MPEGLLREMPGVSYRTLSLSGCSHNSYQQLLIKSYTLWKQWKKTLNQSWIR